MLTKICETIPMPNLAKTKMTKYSSLHWAQKNQQKETTPLAQQVTYQNGQLAYGLTEETAVLLKPKYVRDATEVQEKQIMLAGLRMAIWVGGMWETEKKFY